MLCMHSSRLITHASIAGQVYAARLISCMAATVGLRQSLAEAGVLPALVELLSYTHAALLHEGMHSIGRMLPGCRLAQQQAQYNPALVPLLRLYAGANPNPLPRFPHTTHTHTHTHTQNKHISTRTAPALKQRSASCGRSSYIRSSRQVCTAHAWQHPLLSHVPALP